MSNPNSLFDRLRARFAAAIAPDTRDGAGGWVGLAARGTERTPDDHQHRAAAALAAWRDNPYAKRIIDIITDYTVGDGLQPVAPGELGRFVDDFWSHPQNRLDLRLPDLMDELSRAGDLFVVLFRNPADGMSYVRAVPKGEVVEIITADNDWEREMAYVVRADLAVRADSAVRADGRDGRGSGRPDDGRRTTDHGPESAPASESVVGGFGTTTYLSPAHPDAAAAAAVMLHYSINRPVGALLGESELGPVLGWLRAYGRMLDDRVRLNSAARSFLWFVTVPANRVRQKAEQYAMPPEPGSVVIHDEGERWEMQTPTLGGLDAQHDLRALRQAISAGAGQPPHWHGDGGDVNRAVAQAMQDPALRRLRRRQRHLQHIVIDICQTAYERAWQVGAVRRRPERGAIRVDLPDISREDNESLALASQRLAAAFEGLVARMPGWSPTLAREMVPLVFKFAGEPLPGVVSDQIVAELDAAARAAEEQAGGLTR